MMLDGMIMLECFIVESSRHKPTKTTHGLIYRGFSHFKVMIDLTVSTVSAATCLDQGLELAGNSLRCTKLAYFGNTFVKGWSTLISVSKGFTPLFTPD